MDLSVAVYPYGARPLFQVTTYLGPVIYPDPEYLASYYKPYGGKLIIHPFWIEFSEKVEYSLQICTEPATEVPPFSVHKCYTKSN